MKNKRTDTLNKIIHESNELISHLRLRTYDQVCVHRAPREAGLFQRHNPEDGPKVDTDLHRNMRSVQTAIANILRNLDNQNSIHESETIN